MADVLGISDKRQKRGKKVLPFRQQLTFLDRYALKDPDPVYQVGDTVVVHTEGEGIGGEKTLFGTITAKINDDTWEVYTQVSENETKFEQYPETKLVRPLELTIDVTLDRVARGVSQVVENEHERLAVEKNFKELFETPDYWETYGPEYGKNFMPRFLPGGRIINGAGREDVTYFNCYVQPSPPDDYDGIKDNEKLMGQIMRRGGGVGLNISSLRPKGLPVRGTNGIAGGVVPFMEMYSMTTLSTSQAGSRRGALMIILEVEHPDIFDFITCKMDQRKVNGANISVDISEDFIKAVKNDEDWELIWKDTDEFRRIYGYDVEEDPTLFNMTIKHWKRRGLPVKVIKTVKAREIWNLISETAAKSAEPGVVRLDLYNELSNTNFGIDQETWETLGELIIATNPCGEQGLGEWGVCNLGSMVVPAFVNLERVRSLIEKYGDMANVSFHDKMSCFEWEDWKLSVAEAVSFLDMVIDRTPYFFPDNEKQQKNWIRRIGLGTMGEADACVLLGIRWGSEEYLAFMEKLHKEMANSAYEKSAMLAADKGPAPIFEEYGIDKLMERPFIQRLDDNVKEMIAKYGLRNGHLLTQAPTGTTASVIGVSSGIEPIFSFEYMRKDRLGVAQIRHWLFEKWCKDNNVPRITIEDTDYSGNVHQVEIYDTSSVEIPDYFVTTEELTPREHVLSQATIQYWVDSSISKTTNLDPVVNDNGEVDWEATKKLVQEVYDLAFENEICPLKGITVYVKGSREGVLQSINKESPKKEKNKETTEEAPVVEKRHRKRPEMLPGRTYKMETPFGNALFTLNERDGILYEIIVTMSKSGSDINGIAETIGRLASAALQAAWRAGETDMAYVLMEQLDGIKGSNPIGFGARAIHSLSDALAKVIKKYLEDKAGEKNQETVLIEEELRISAPVMTGVNPYAVDFCPSCSQFNLQKAEGCWKCPEEYGGCGYEKC